MKTIIKPRLIALALAGSLSLAGCGPRLVSGEEVITFEEVEQEQEDKYEAEIEEHVSVPALNKAEPTTTEVKEAVVEEEKEFNPIDSVVNVEVVMGTANVNIRKEPNEESERLGTIAKNDYMSYHGEEGNWYIVNIHGEKGYVSKDYATRTLIQQVNLPLQKVVMCTEEKTMDIIYDHIIMPKYECAEVYYEDEDKYFVQTNDHIGYITKDNTCDMQGTYAIVDISDQEVRVYEDNELIYFSPVVTGRNNATHIGEFEIYHISTSRYLVGPNYRSYVDYMLKFDENIGLHDAEYHTDANGRSHGWRDFSEFGGDTYLTDGSHGCVNLPHDTAQFVYENMTYNDKVIVKK